MEADDTPTTDQDDHIILTTREEAFAELADLNTPRQDLGIDPEDSSAPEFDADAATAPPVVAVVVVHNAGDWLDATLTSLGSQTYGNLSVLVIDADSDIDPTPRVAQVLPGAFVRRLEHNVGFGPTLNEVLDLVSGASFFCFCHDDVALDPDCIHRLVEEAFRSNAGIVGPKLVDWDDSEVLLQVGFTIDKSGGRAPYADRGELDQGQHDAVRDVFAVPGGCMLVRADLFAHLGGFDPEIDLLGEDLDLCWRSHLVGGRVVVAPAARVRHREALATSVDAERLARVEAAHRVRSVLSNYRLWHLLLLLPQIFVIAVIEAIIEASIGRRSNSRAILAAWGTNVRGLPSVLRARKRVSGIREHNDRSIRQLQTHTWARLDGLIQAHRRSATTSGVGATIGTTADTTPPEASRRERSLVPYGVIAVAIVVVAGTRDLFFGPLPPVGSFARAPGSLSDLWSLWLGTWNPMGLGSSQSPAAGLAPMALVGSVFGGAFGFLRRVAILLPIPLALFGMWRLARPIGSRRSQLVALVVYVAVPVPWNALSQGRWGGLLIYAAAPWLVQFCARAMRAAPFSGDRGVEPASRARWWAQLLGVGLLLGVVGSLVPAVAAVIVIIAVGLALGSVLTGRFAGVGRMLVVIVGGVIVAALLLLPWTAVGPARSLATFAGMGSGTHGWLGTTDLLRFASGPFGSGVLGYALLAVAALPLVIGRSWRFAWGVRAWCVAVACWAVVWLGQQSWFDVVVPAPEVLFAPAAAALAVAAACGMAAIEADLPGYRFGWAQAVSVLAGVALFLGVLPTLGSATDGRWKMAPVGLDQALGFISAQRTSEGFRVLWVGDPDVVPVAGWRSGDRLTVGLSNDAMPTMTELWAPGDPGKSRAVLQALDLAVEGQTTRIGRVLADMGVRYVVLPRQIAPLPYRTTAHTPPASVVGALDDQLDLARITVNDAVVVYRNDAWKPGCTLWPQGTPTGHSVADALDASDGTSVLKVRDRVCSGTGTLSRMGIVATHRAADSGWRMTVDGRRAKPVTLWGWEQGFIVPRAGKVHLSYRAGSQRWLILILVALGWCLVIAGWFIGRRRSSAGALVDSSAELDADEGSLVQVGESPGLVEVDEVRVGESSAPEEPEGGP